MDASGKDGTVKHVVGQVNPAGARITSFGKPTKEELAHDFLWRITNALPTPGQIGVFNRSHYEDVLIVRVHDLVPRTVWSRRYARINAWERRVAATGCTIVKVFLHMSKDEQKAAPARAHRGPDQALEGRTRRHLGAAPLGRLPGRVRRSPHPLQHRRRAVVRRARRPQVVPRLGRQPPAARDPARPWTSVGRRPPASTSRR